MLGGGWRRRRSDAHFGERFARRGIDRGGAVRRGKIGGDIDFGRAHRIERTFPADDREQGRGDADHQQYRREADHADLHSLHRLNVVANQCFHTCVAFM